MCIQTPENKGRQEKKQFLADYNPENIITRCQECSEVDLHQNYQNQEQRYDSKYNHEYNVLERTISLFKPLFDQKKSILERNQFVGNKTLPDVMNLFFFFKSD